MSKIQLKEWRTVRQTNNEARRLRLEERKKRRVTDSNNEKKTRNQEDQGNNEDQRNHGGPEKEERSEKIEENCSNDKNEEQSVPVKIAPPPKATILTPQRLSPPATDLREIISPSNGGLDYADFDNDTSSPFDNMELKTINDMEELAQVCSQRPNNDFLLNIPSHYGKYG